METLSIVVMNWRDIRNPDAGGAEVYTHELAKRWATLGHNVTLLTSMFRGAAADEVIDSVHVIRRGTRFTVYRRARQTYLSSYKGRADAVIDAINTIPFFTPKFVNDGARLFSLVFQLAREGWYYETPLPVAVAGRYFLEDRWLRLYASIPTFAISDSTKRDLLGMGFKKVIVVTPGATPAPAGSLRIAKAATPTLLFLGRLKKYKLPDHALAAFEWVRRRLPDARLWVVGEGYMRKKLEKRAAAGVTFYGKVSEADKLALLQQAHLLLFPSVREGWGLGVTEANVFGVPAIGYDVPGLRDSIRDGVTGILVPPNDPRAMGEAAADLLAETTRLHKMAEAARAWSASLSWDAAAAGMLRHLDGNPDPTN